MPKHLLDTEQLTTAHIHDLLSEAATYLSPTGGIHCAIQPLVGRTVVMAFFEPSTRTRLSFEMAAKKLGATVLNFTPEGSSVDKGESLRETFRTIEAMGVDAIVLRHAQDGVHAQLASWTRMSVLNAGEGRTAHPTQALLDASTLRERLKSLEGVRLTIVGDVAHSRVARSNVDVLSKCGVAVALCAPNELLPNEPWIQRHQRHHSIDDALAASHVVCMLRMQRERFERGLAIDADTYRQTYALTMDRAVAHPNVTVMHPGPVNVGVELDADVLDLPQTIIHRQVTHGVAMRMAVLRRHLL